MPMVLTSEKSWSAIKSKVTINLLEYLDFRGTFLSPEHCVPAITVRREVALVRQILLA